MISLSLNNKRLLGDGYERAEKVVVGHLALLLHGRKCLVEEALDRGKIVLEKHILHSLVELVEEAADAPTIRFRCFAILRTDRPNARHQAGELFAGNLCELVDEASAHSSTACCS